MFDFERATDYIRSLELPGSALSEEIQKDALAGDVPIIRPETASFLLFLIISCHVFLCLFFLQ